MNNLDTLRRDLAANEQARGEISSEVNRYLAEHGGRDRIPSLRGPRSKGSRASWPLPSPRLQEITEEMSRLNKRHAQIQIQIDKEVSKYGI